MMRAPLKVALIPMTSTDRVEVNVRNILKSLAIIDQKLDVVFLPENSLYFNFNAKLDKTHVIHATLEALEPLKEWAKSHHTVVHLGGVPFFIGDQVSNTSLLIDTNGKIKPVYQKIHLFDVDIPDRRVRESDNFTPGVSPAILEINGWRIGLSICYDLRFSELYVYYHEQNVDAIVVPSSFLVETGRAHWEVLLRARAIEAQSYVLAPAQMGVHKSELKPEVATRTTWGESMVIGPWGEVLARSASFDRQQNTDIDLKPLVVELNKEPIEKVRSQMPTLSHRRL
ncbi:MAG: carbon-nitrogen hydrolase family protein [Bdellovibrionaceae bacterium]|nr:carbon-nitrogen hydrolase family protein [Pseudobdellovibrionaceae bacterium]